MRRNIFRDEIVVTHPDEGRRDMLGKATPRSRYLVFPGELEFRVDDRVQFRNRDIGDAVTPKTIVGEVGLGIRLVPPWICQEGLKIPVKCALLPLEPFDRNTFFWNSRITGKGAFDELFQVKDLDAAIVRKFAAIERKFEFIAAFDPEAGGNFGINRPNR